MLLVIHAICLHVEYSAGSVLFALHECVCIARRMRLNRHAACMYTHVLQQLTGSLLRSVIITINYFFSFLFLINKHMPPFSLAAYMFAMLIFLLMYHKCIACWIEYRRFVVTKCLKYFYKC